MADPEPIYRARFLARLRELRPQSLLDVGCGTGDLLAELAGSLPRVAGLEADADRIAAAKARGLDARQGDAEALPFETGSFDLVTFQFVPHHLRDWATALREALRVAGKGVVILEGWYQRDLPAQDVAARYEDWAKRIDRATGMIHALYPSACALLAPMGTLAGHDIDIRHDLVYAWKPYDEVAADAEEQLSRSPEPEAARDELQLILTDARRLGFGYEGALTVTIMKI